MSKPPTLEGTKAEATVGHEDVFDITKALNTAGFAEFMGKHSEYQNFDMDDSKFVADKFEVFKKAEEVKKNISELYKKNIQEEMGIILGPEDMKCMDVDLDAKAVDSPEDIIRLHEKFATMAKNQESVKELEGRLAAFGDRDIKAETMAQKKAELDKALLAKKMISGFGKAKVWTTFISASIGSGILGFLGREDISLSLGEVATEQKKKVEAYKEMVNADKDKKIDYKKIKEITDKVSKEIEELQTKLDIIDSTAGMKELSETAFKGLRGQIIEGVASYQGIQNAIRIKAKDQLVGLMKKNTVEGFDSAQERLNKFIEASENMGSGVDPLKGADIDGIQKVIDEGLAYQGALQMDNALKNAKLGTNSFNNLEKALKGWIERQRVGSKEGDEAREAVKKMLVDARDKLTDSDQDKAKFVMINTIIRRLK